MYNKSFFKTTKINDIVMYESYGGAKTWGRVISIDNDRVTIANNYYKSYYDKHLTGRTSGTTTISKHYPYPCKNFNLHCPKV